MPDEEFNDPAFNDYCRFLNETQFTKPMPEILIDLLRLTWCVAQANYEIGEGEADEMIYIDKTKFFIDEPEATQ